MIVVIAICLVAITVAIVIIGVKKCRHQCNNVNDVQDAQRKKSN